MTSLPSDDEVARVDAALVAAGASTYVPVKIDVPTSARGKWDRRTSDPLPLAAALRIALPLVPVSREVAVFREDATRAGVFLWTSLEPDLLNWPAAGEGG